MKRNYKKLVASVMSTVLMLGSITFMPPKAEAANIVTSSVIEIEDDETDYETEDETAKLYDNNNGYNDVDIEIPSIHDDLRIAEYNALGDMEIPAKYSSKTTKAREQGSYDTCWAFSAVAAAEANIVNKGLGNANDLNLSELHLIYFFYNTEPDSLGGTYGDSSMTSNNDFLYVGGNNVFTTFELAKWIGMADESVADYSDASPDMTLNKEDAYNDMYHMQNAYWIRTKDVNDVKKMIMKYGAVTSAYYNDSTKYNRGSDGFSFYDSYHTNTNHAVTIVGWDDNYDRSNFKLSSRPKNNGAWLVKNSWGTQWGDDGYFWMSYETEALNTDNAKCFAFDYEGADNYTHNYQYDGSCGIQTLSVTNGGSISNVFTASGNKNGVRERLDAVSFAFFSTNVDYSIQIYKNLTDPTDPTSGTAMLSTPQTGTTSYTGYYTVKLNEPVILNKGDTFSVVVTPTSHSGSTSVFFDTTYDNSNWVSFISAVNEGQSFCKFNGTSQWLDLKNLGNRYTNLDEAVARIKAFTTDLEDEKIEKIYFESDSGSINVSESMQLKAFYEPEYLNDIVYTWKSDNPSIAAVDSSGLVKGISAGTANITAAYEDKTATFQITVKALTEQENNNNQNPPINETTQTKPQKVTGIKISSNSTSKIKISWNKSDNASGYNIYKYIPSSKKYKKIAATSKTYYTDKKLKAGSEYRYKIEAYKKADGKTVKAKQSSVFKAVTKPSKAKISSVKKLSGSKARVTWKKVSGASGYEVYISTKKNNGYKRVKTVSGEKKLNTTISSLKKKQKYYIKVRAYKKSGSKYYGSYSSIKTLTIK